MRFAVVTGEDVIEGYGMPANAVSLALYKNYDEGKEVYTGALADLPAWLLARSEPAVRAMEWYEQGREWGWGVGRGGVGPWRLVFLLRATGSGWYRWCAVRHHALRADVGRGHPTPLQRARPFESQC